MLDKFNGLKWEQDVTISDILSIKPSHDVLVIHPGQNPILTNNKSRVLVWLENDSVIDFLEIG